MKISERERLVLIGVLRDRERQANLDPNGSGLPLGERLGAYRIRIRDARQGLVPMNPAEWIGRTPTNSDSVMLCRTYKRLESLGLVERVNVWGGAKTTHVKLTADGEAMARQLTGMETTKGAS
jgi:hypothetical protein